MNARRLGIITTRLAPQVCGVGAYSWQLQRHWPDQNGTTQFFVVDGAKQSVTALKYSAIEQFDASSSKLATALNRFGTADIILHYAARPYSRWGCPFWLPPVLQQWKRAFPAGRLLVFFHELPAKLPVTSRHFWIGLANRRIIRQLLCMADVVVTNTEEHRSQLKALTSRTDVNFCPVGSNIEPIETGHEVRAPEEFVLFGLPFGRWQTLQFFDRYIRSWQQQGLLDKLHLIGPSEPKFDRFSRDIISAWPNPGAVVEHGMLGADDVSQLLTSARFGLTHATLANWSKSGVFMAYAAHACSIIAAMQSSSEPACFTISAEQLGALSSDDVNQRARSLKNWYERNADWNVIALKMANLLRGAGKAELVT